MDYLSIAMGKNIRKFRKAKGMSQGQLAYEVCDGDIGRVSRWETGRFCPSAYYLVRLVRELECSFDDLCEGYEV